MLRDMEKSQSQVVQLYTSLRNNDMYLIRKWRLYSGKSNTLIKFKLQLINKDELTCFAGERRKKQLQVKEGVFFFLSSSVFSFSLCQTAVFIHLYGSTCPHNRPKAETVNLRKM